MCPYQANHHLNMYKLSSLNQLQYGKIIVIKDKIPMQKLRKHQKKKKKEKKDCLRFYFLIV